MEVTNWSPQLTWQAWKAMSFFQKCLGPHGPRFNDKNPLKQRSPTFLEPGTSFVEDNFSMDWGWRGWFGDDSSIYYTLYFYYYYINSTSDHQVLDPESWGPLPYMMLPFYSVTLFFFYQKSQTS